MSGILNFYGEEWWLNVEATSFTENADLFGWHTNECFIEGMLQKGHFSNDLLLRVRQISLDH